MLSAAATRSLCVAKLPGIVQKIGQSLGFPFQEPNGGMHHLLMILRKTSPTLSQIWSARTALSPRKSTRMLKDL